jgi:tRNA threonylcarbamoyladenosine modification (KEOPS) complex  Pcc1 subunit
MNYQTLYDEITNDPLGVGYATMTDAQIAAALNNKTRSRVKDSIEASELVAAIEATDLSGLTADQREQLHLLISAGKVKISNKRVKDLLQALFSGTTTISNLLALATEAISRAEELGLGKVMEEDVAAAKLWATI